VTKYAPQTKYDVSVSGGSKNASYYFSFGALDKEGYLKRKDKQIEFNRYNITLKAEFMVKDWLTLEEKILFNTQVSDKPHNYGQDANLQTLARVPPYMPIQFPDLPYYIEPGDREKYEQYIGMYI